MRLFKKAWEVIVPCPLVFHYFPPFLPPKTPIKVVKLFSIETVCLCCRSCVVVSLDSFGGLWYRSVTCFLDTGNMLRTVVRCVVWTGQKAQFIWQKLVSQDKKNSTEIFSRVKEGKKSFGALTNLKKVSTQFRSQKRLNFYGEKQNWFPLPFHPTERNCFKFNFYNKEGNHQKKPFPPIF